MDAVAGPANAQPDGRRYPILVFARGEGEDAAVETGFAGLAALGWVEAALSRTGEITDPDAVPEDLRGALQRALRDGCALIVYDDA